MQSENYPEWPRLVVSGGNQLHAAWFTRDKLYSTQDEHVALRVWYSSKPLRTAAVAQPPLFTPTPQPTVLATATPVPTPTATPVVIPADVLATPPIAGPPAWELPGLAVALLTTLATAVLLGGWVGLVLWMRRRRARSTKNIW
jgi:hypothetical protein